MTRVIRASEAKPGMEVEFTLTRRMTIRNVITWDGSHRELRDDTGHVARVDADTPVTVVSEPAPPQPEEPTEFGARVVVDGRRFLRADDHVRPWLASEVWTWYTWAHLCSLGPVTVVPDQGWTVPAETELTPEVPDRVDEWDTWEDVPEGVAVENSTLWYYYRKVGGKIEALGPTTGGVWRETSLPPGDFPGTWTRVSDA